MTETSGRTVSGRVRAASAAKRAALATVALLLATACEEEPVEVLENVRAIKTITVSERGSGQLRRFPGIVEAVDTSSISFEVAGNTRDVNVTVGDRVEEGQVLATLDDKPFQLNV
ncbi:MAG: biotin/lipoyl-binding protein, partial [Kiloniellales bacterium]|nr:biotin/lipoyl-binding protein [Kiloniellales bacterium]